ncbi:unnamed protein product [marine sediment metagenome]|uniref:Uncharacterized protein n=1 Tax=marine sediment metagenome TaxID=412755 RepID=X1BC25_9ZZZZ
MNQRLEQQYLTDPLLNRCGMDHSNYLGDVGYDGDDLIYKFR